MSDKSVLSDEPIKIYVEAFSKAIQDNNSISDARMIGMRAVAEAAIAADRAARAEPVGEVKHDVAVGFINWFDWPKKLPDGTKLYTAPPAAPVVPEEWRQAIECEPELPDAMPDEMWAAIKDDRDAATEAMRLAVRFTKAGILARLSALLAAPPAAPVVTTEEGRHCGDPDCVPCRDPAEPAAPVVPEGWREVTKELVSHLRLFTPFYDDCQCQSCLCVRKADAMLAAAPEPSQEPNP